MPSVMQTQSCKRLLQIIAVALTFAAAVSAGLYLGPAKDSSQFLAKGGHTKSCAAEEPSLEATMALRVLNRQGLNAESRGEFEQAEQYYIQAAEQGYRSAQWNLAHFYAEGLNGEKNYAEALRWFFKLAETGDAEAQQELGFFFLDGTGVEKSSFAAKKWFTKAGEQGLAEAQFQLGLLYYNGVEENPDYIAAREWFQKAAAQGHALAQENMGVMLHSGRGGNESVMEAKEWFYKSAKQGNPDAQLKYGLTLEVEKNHKEARTWFLKAANQGNLVAEYYLGAQSFYGKGTERNIREAIERYERAVNVDDSLSVSARLALIQIYVNEDSAEYDAPRARHHSRILAEGGNADAQCMLGMMFEGGIGGERNLTKAKEWYERAAAQGMPEAREQLKKLNANEILKEIREPEIGFEALG